MRKLRQACGTVQQTRCAIDDEEEIGVRCVGAPVLNAERRVIAAISVSGPTSQIHSS